MDTVTSQEQLAQMSQHFGIGLRFGKFSQVLSDGRSLGRGENRHRFHANLTIRILGEQHQPWIGINTRHRRDPRYKLTANSRIGIV